MILPDNVYTILKWIAATVIPAVATLVGTIGTALNWDNTGLAVTIITAVGTAIAAVITTSHVAYTKAANAAAEPEPVAA
jgi:hypothetical protein